MNYKLIEIAYGKKFLMYSEYLSSWKKSSQSEFIQGPEDMSEDLEDSTMQCRLVENREDFRETYPDLCRQHIYVMYWYNFQGLHGRRVLRML